jgi:hypothetical protein
MDMSRRISTLCLVLLVAACAIAKDKKKQLLPNNVLRAQTVLVVIHPDAGEPLTDPRANRTAHDDVEQAMMTWGRFRVVRDTETADLIIAVRKGHANGPTIKNAPADTTIYPPTRQPSSRQPPLTPPLTNPPLARPSSSGPHISNEAGPAEDTFEVYLGRIEYPLEAAPVWRYSAKDALKAPHVRAVEQFRNLIDESEKQLQQKP